MTKTTPSKAPTKPEGRSRVSNGKALFIEGVDGRTHLARRFRDIVAEMSGDLGGAEYLSEAQRQLIRRCAMLSVTCEAMEAKAIAGDEGFDLEAYGAVTDRLGRALVRLGLKREARNVTPNLRNYLEGKGS